MLAQSVLTKKLTVLFFGLFLGLLLLAPGVSAQEDAIHKLCGGANLTFDDAAKGCNKDAKGQTEGNDPQVKANKLLADIINIISVIIGVLAVIMIIYAGFRFITSGGNPEHTKAARNTILYAIIGLVIVAFAQFIVKFVLGKLNQTT
jgi:hypothetical protein